MYQWLCVDSSVASVMVSGVADATDGTSQAQANTYKAGVAELL